MAKFAHNDVLDAPWNYIKTNCTRQIACSAQPADFAGVAAVSVADVAMSAADFTLADGTTSGRKMTVAAKNGVAVDATATANHIVLVDDTNLKLLYVTTAANLALTAGAGNAVNFPAWSAEFADPV